MGIINGKTATEFAPDDALTREEAAVIHNALEVRVITVFSMLADVIADTAVYSE